MTTQTATKTKKAPAPRQPAAKGALRKAQLTAEATAAEIKLVPSPELMAAVEAEQVEAVVVEVAAPKVDAMKATKTVAKPKAAKAPKAEGTYTMTGVYHVFQKAWAAGGKRAAYTPDEIHALLVADGGKTK